MTTLPDLVQTLAGLHLERRELETRIALVEKEIFRQATEELRVVDIPMLNSAAKFVCAGKIVELRVSTFGSRGVQVFEVESLPYVL